MRTFITERLPMAVTKSCAALDSITATAWNIAKNTEDDRVKLNALTLVKETEKDKIDIVSNVNLVDQIVSETDQRQQTQQDPAQLVGQGSEEDLPQLGESENNLLQPVVVSSEELDTDSPEEEEDPAPVTRARAIPVDDSGDRD
jgi:hypothetical protein